MELLRIKLYWATKLPLLVIVEEDYSLLFHFGQEISYFEYLLLL